MHGRFEQLCVLPPHPASTIRARLADTKGELNASESRVHRCRVARAAAVSRTRPGLDHRRRQGHVRRVLPGVTVEASSPGTDRKGPHGRHRQSGRYRIVDLRPGTYTVTFTLPGFSTVRREGIELPGTFTATVDADTEGRPSQETVTVTGESPIVDVQSMRRQTVLDSDMISSIPATRSYNSLMQLMPNTVTQAGAAMDAQVVPGMVVFGGAGGRSNEGRVNVDGISVGSAFNGAGVSSYIADVGNAREVTMTTSGGLGEAEGGGPSLNIVPKEGGNSVRGSFYAAGVTEGMIGSNYTQELRIRGLTTPGETAQGVGLQPRRRRADHEGPAVVLRHVPRRRQRALGARHVRQRRTPAIRPSGPTWPTRAARPSTPRRTASTRCA